MGGAMMPHQMTVLITGGAGDLGRQTALFGGDLRRAQDGRR